MPLHLPSFFVRSKDDGATHSEAAHIPGGRSVRDLVFGANDGLVAAFAVVSGVHGAAVSTAQPIRVPDVTHDSRYIMVNPETRSELAIPMQHKGKIIGVLDLESPQVNAFREDHVQTLSILAANLAVSLENARLYEQVARDEARLERDLAAAKRIQGALIRPVPAEDFGLDIAARYSYRNHRNAF